MAIHSTSNDSMDNDMMAYHSRVDDVMVDRLVVDDTMANNTRHGISNEASD
jgi:hypothetical protein